MSGDFVHYAMRKPAAPPRAGQSSGVPQFHGKVMKGRVVRLFVGQGHGFIRLDDAREVFFHRADVGPDTKFNELRVGVELVFELFEDMVSGARALHISRRRRAG